MKPRGGKLAIIVEFDCRNYCKFTPPTLFEFLQLLLIIASAIIVATIIATIIATLIATIIADATIIAIPVQ